MATVDFARLAEDCYGINVTVKRWWPRLCLSHSSHYSNLGTCICVSSTIHRRQLIRKGQPNNGDRTP